MPVKQRQDLIDGLTRDLTGHIIDIRSRRTEIHQTWLHSHRIWAKKRISNQLALASPDDDLQEIAFVRKAIERTIVRAQKMLMPNVKWFEVAAIGDVSDTKLSNVDNFMWYILRKKVKSKTNISQLLRSLVLYGRCHLKTSIAVRNGQVWPTQRVVDPFSFYIYPETAVTLDEADIVFEDFSLSYELYKGLVDTGMVQDVAVSELTEAQWPDHLTERLSNVGLTHGREKGLPTPDKAGKQQSATPFLSLTEAWIHREDKLFQAYIVWNLRQPRIVAFFESAYDEPMYKTAVHRALPNEAYGPSIMEDVEGLDDICNRFLRQFNHAVNREQGVYGVDTTQLPRSDNLEMSGGALWKFNGDPREAMNFISPPNTSVNQLRAFQIILGLINAMGATGTVAEGQPGRNMPRAGGAMNNLVNLAMADTQDLSELVEQEVLTPSLGDVYHTVRFIPDSQLIKIPGGLSLTSKATNLRKEDLTGEYEFEWVGSLQFQDDQIRAQRMMIFLNLLPQLKPMLQEIGYGFNIAELVQTVWRYSLGERGLKNVILPLDELQKHLTEEQRQRGAGMQQEGGAASQNGASPIGGLKYSLPNVTNGFVQQS